MHCYCNTFTLFYTLNQVERLVLYKQFQMIIFVLKKFPQKNKPNA